MSIKVIERPNVFPVGRQQVNVPALDAFLASEGVGNFQSDAKKAGEELVEIAGRLCYMSFKKPRPGGNAAYINHILEVGHGSVVEHEVFNFIVTGVSRSLTHELVRHRAGMSYSQLSQRYVDESDVAFVVPPALIETVDAGRNWLVYSQQESATQSLRGVKPRDDGWICAPYTAIEGAGLRWLAMAEQSLRDYQYLSDWLGTKGVLSPSVDVTARRKQAREAARSVLPNCTETKIFVTANARALRHFVEMRGDAGADAEIRRLAHAVLAMLVVESPVLFGDYTIERSGTDETEVITTPHRKV